MESTILTASAQQSLTRSAAAKEGEQASSWQEDLKGVPVAPTASTDAVVTSKTAKTTDVDAAGKL